MAAAAPDTAVSTTVVDSMAMAVATTMVATVAATMSQPAVRGTGARVSSGLLRKYVRKGQRTAGSRGEESCRQAGAGAEAPAIRRESVALVMFVAGRGRCQRERSARR